MQNQRLPIHLLGVGRFTPVCMELAEECGYNVVALWHYESGREGEQVAGCEIKGSFADLFAQPSLSGMRFMLTMGDNRLRGELATKIVARGGIIPSLVHPTAIISRFADISPIGVQIYPYVDIRANTCVERNSVISPHSHIGHDVTIGADCFIASGAIIGAYSKIGERVLWGIGAISVSGKADVGDDAVIGAGAVLTRNVAASTTVAGNPARPILHPDNP